MYRIAFGHKKRVGKDYACEYLKRNHGFQVLRIAEPVYELSYEIQTYFEHDNTKDRDLLRLIGMWMRDNISRDIWINALTKKLTRNEKYVVADLRFKNEAEILRKNGFKLVN